MGSVLDADLCSHNHIYMAKYLFFIRDDWLKNLRDTKVLVREVFTSGCRPPLKKLANGVLSRNGEERPREAFVKGGIAFT